MILWDVTEDPDSLSLTWSATDGGKRTWVTFDDDVIYDLGVDPTGDRYELIADRMRSGDYYPADAVRFTGSFRAEKRLLEPGDRVIQYAPSFGRFGGVLIASAVEIFASERESNRCRVGYVTTSHHHARGIWSAELTRDGDRLSIRVRGTARPNTWLFWIGLPCARLLQKRAWRRAIEEFRSL